MGKVVVNFRIDKETKQEMEKTGGTVYEVDHD